MNFARRRSRARGQTSPEKRVAWQVVSIGAACFLAIAFGFMVDSVLAYGEGHRDRGRRGLRARAVAHAWLAIADGRALEGRGPAEGAGVRAAPAHARRVALLAHARDAPPERRAAPQGDGDRAKRPRQRASLSKVVEDAISSIREGESIAQPLKRSGDFPPIVTHMIAVGEKSGQLETMLENVARAYDTQVDTRVQALTSLLEPLMMIVMGGAVGFIAFSILMPLVQMNDFVQQ